MANVLFGRPLSGRAIHSYSSKRKFLWGNRYYPLRRALAYSLVFIILPCMLPSCMTADKCNRRYPPAETLIIKDSIITNTTTVFRDTVVLLQLPPDTITVFSREYVRDTVDPSLINIDTINSENDFSVALAWVNQSHLGLSLIQKDSGIMFLIDSAVRETAHFRELYHTQLNKQVKTVRYIPVFYRFCSYFFFITITALIVLVFFKLRKFLPFL